MPSVDVVVIGCGAVGACITYELARRGVAVVAVDAGADVGAGCSYANAGLLSPSHVETLATPSNVAAGLRYLFAPASPFFVHPDPRLVPWLARFVASSTPRRAARITRVLRSLARRSLDRHRDYAAHELGIDYRRFGSLDVYLSDPGWERGRARAGAAPLLSPREAHALEPAVGDIRGAVYHPEDTFIDSRQFVRAVLDAATRQGATIYWNAPVRRLQTTNARIERVEVGADTVRARDVVVAAGLGAGALTASVGVRLPLRGARGYVIDLAVAGGAPRMPVTFRERRVVATPYDDRLRLSGTLELGRDHAPVDRRRVAAIRAAGQEGLPRLQVQRVVETWAGLRPTTPDGVPALGRSGRVENLLVATGHSMWGMMLAPVTGELVAADIVDGVASRPHPDFDPDRFTSARR